MSFRIPEIGFGGRPVKGALDHLLAKKPQTASVAAPSIPTRPAQNTGIDLSAYVNLESPQNLYRPMLVSLERTHGGKDWNQAHEALRGEGAHMLTIRQFADFLALLKGGQAYDGNLAAIDSRRLEECYNDITEVRSPWRSEWLDARFSVKDKQSSGIVGKGKALVGLGEKEYSMTYHVIDANGGYTELTDPIERNTLLSDQTPGIDLESWIRRATPQGLPVEGVTGGQMYYWYPRDDKVAGFVANSGRAVLYCVGDPRGSVSALGVRACRAKI